MIKSIFINIIKKNKNLSLLSDVSSAYKLFRENGYTENFESFKEELGEFLDSKEIQELASKASDEVSGEVLKDVSGGAGMFRRALVGGVASLMAALSLSASASATTVHDSGYTEPSASVSQSYDYNAYEQNHNAYNQGYSGQNQGYGSYNQGYGGYNQGYSGQNQGYDSYNQGYSGQNQGYDSYNQGYGGYNQGYSGQNQGYGSYNQGYSGQNQGYDSYNQGYSGQNQGYGGYNQGYDFSINNEKDLGSVIDAEDSFSSDTAADSVDVESRNNGDQNEQSNVNNNVEVVENKKGNVPPPPPPPPPPPVIKASGNNAKKVENNVEQKSREDELADKMRKLKKADKQDASGKKGANQKDFQALILEQRAKMKKNGENANVNKVEAKKQNNGDKNEQANVNNNVEVVENKKGNVPPPPPPPPPPPVMKANVNNAKKVENNVEQKSMADKLADAKKNLKKADKQDVNKKKEGEKKGGNFLQNALHQAIINRRQNLHMHDDDEGEIEDDDWD